MVEKASLAHEIINFDSNFVDIICQPHQSSPKRHANNMVINEKFIQIQELHAS